jgi:hypothetical protein
VLPKQYGTSKHPLFVIQPLIKLVKRLCRHAPPVLSTLTSTRRASHVAWQRLSVLQSSHSAHSSVSSDIGSSDAATAIELGNSAVHSSSGLNIEHDIDNRDDSNANDNSDNSNTSTNSSAKRYFEHAPAHAVGRVYIEGLTKVYGAKTAVNNLNLRLYEGVTTLLGHNSAGKSTTIGMLTGDYTNICAVQLHAIHNLCNAYVHTAMQRSYAHINQR